MTGAEGGSSSSGCLGAGFDQMFRIGGTGHGLWRSYPLFTAKSRRAWKNHKKYGSHRSLWFPLIHSQLWLFLFGDISQVTFMFLIWIPWPAIELIVAHQYWNEKEYIETCKFKAKPNKRPRTETGGSVVEKWSSVLVQQLRVFRLAHLGGCCRCCLAASLSISTVHWQTPSGVRNKAGGKSYQRSGRWHWCWVLTWPFLSLQLKSSKSLRAIFTFWHDQQMLISCVCVFFHLRACFSINL